MATARRSARALDFLGQAEFLLPLAALTMEICALFPWMVFFTALPKLPWQNPPLSLISCIVVLGVAYLSAAASDAKRLKTRLRILILAANLFLFLLLLRVEQGGNLPLWDPAGFAETFDRTAAWILGSFFGLYLLWRGMTLGREPVGFDRLYLSFRWGLASLALLLVVWGMAASSGSFRSPGVSMNVLVAVFFFAGLAGLALSNYINMQQEARRLGKRAQSLSRRWVGLALLLAMGVALISFVIASTVSFGTVVDLLAPFGWIVTGISYILVYGIGYPVGFLSAVIVYISKWLLSLIKRGPTPEFMLPKRPDMVKRDEPEGQNSDWFLEFVDVAKWGILFLLLALCVYLLLRYYLRSRRPPQAQEFEESSESIWSKEQFWSDARSFWNSLLNRLFGRFHHAPATVAAAAPIPPPAMTDDGRTLTVREIYQGVLWEGRRWGKPKEDAETPHEYADRLGTAMPATAQELKTITDGYALERYGPTATPEEKVPVLNQVWRRLRGLFQPDGKASG